MSLTPSLACDKSFGGSPAKFSHRLLWSFFGFCGGGGEIQQKVQRISLEHLHSYIQPLQRRSGCMCVYSCPDRSFRVRIRFSLKVRVRVRVGVRVKYLVLIIKVRVSVFDKIEVQGILSTFSSDDLWGSVACNQWMGWKGGVFYCKCSCFSTGAPLWWRSLLIQRSTMLFTKTLLTAATPDTVPAVYGFQLIQTDRTVESNKRKGGGLAVFENDRCCNSGHFSNEE